MGSKVKNLLSAAAPIIGNAIAPGIGGVVGGALGGAASGGGLKGALTGGLSGALTGYGSSLGGFANDALGLGIDAANNSALSALGGGLGGAALGALSGGGLKGALLGGVGGAAQGYLGNGGLNDLGITGPDSIFGTAAGSPLGGGKQGPTQGSGILGSATRGLSDLGSALSVGTGGGSSTYGSGGTGGMNSLGSLLSGFNDQNAIKKAEKAQLNAQQQRLQAYQPYVNASFNPGDLTQDPGYQFRLEQGTDAINRSLGARGKVFSGEALKAAQDYGQGLADSTYNDAYNRWLRQNAQNIGVADSISGVYDDQGDVRANADILGANSINRTLSNLLRGYGAYSGY